MLLNKVEEGIREPKYNADDASYPIVKAFNRAVDRQIASE